MAKQDDDEMLEVFLQRILAIAMDGYKDVKSNIWQQLATDAFLRDCRHKDAVTTVMNESQKSVHEACKRIKTILANKKAITGGKVSFQEKIFSVQEETRVLSIEKKSRRFSPSNRKNQFVIDNLPLLSLDTHLVLSSRIGKDRFLQMRIEGVRPVAVCHIRVHLQQNKKLYTGMIATVEALPEMGEGAL